MRAKTISSFRVRYWILTVGLGIERGEVFVRAHWGHEQLVKRSLNK